jgi:uncharacterized membrane protein
MDIGPTQAAIDLLAGIAEWTRLGLELLGALAITGGAIATLVELASTLQRGEARVHDRVRVRFTAARYQMSRYLALALEFQLAADVLDTAIAPDWSKIGKLAAIGAIRTALNFFLTREMAEERKTIVESQERQAA